MNSLPDNQLTNTISISEKRLSKNQTDSFLQKKRKNSNPDDNNLEILNTTKKVVNEKPKENKIIDSDKKEGDIYKKLVNGNDKKQNLSDTEIIDLNSNTENKNELKKTQNNNIIKTEKENIEKEVKIENINNDKNKLEENNINDLLNINNNNNEDNFDNNSLSNQLSISLKSKEKVNKAEKVKNLYTSNGLLNDKNIIFRDNLGYEFDIQICGLRIQMGPFLSDRKARSVIKFINHSKYIINSISYVSKKEWFKNLSQMIEELTE